MVYSINSLALQFRCCFIVGYIIQDDLTEPEDSSEEESDVDNFEFKNLPTKKSTTQFGYKYIFMYILIL